MQRLILRIGLVGALLAAAAAGACSNDSETHGAGGSAATGVEAFCQGKVARDTSCNGSSTETVAACMADSDTACMFDAARPEIIDALVTCLNQRPCGQSDDDCFYQVGADAPTPGQTDYQQACTTKHDACTPSFMDDYCAITIVTSAAYANLMTCLDSACADVAACLDSALPASCQ
jgi:hypothetical protein